METVRDCIGPTADLERGDIPSAAPRVDPETAVSGWNPERFDPVGGDIFLKRQDITMEKEENQSIAAEAHTVTPDSPAAARIAEDIREKMSSLRPQAAEGAQHAADAAHRAAGSLRGQEEWAVQLIEQGAAKLSDLAETLRTRRCSQEPSNLPAANRCSLPGRRWRSALP